MELLIILHCLYNHSRYNKCMQKKFKQKLKIKVLLTICLHSMCSISEIKIPALPTGSKGLLNSL